MKPIKFYVAGTKGVEYITDVVIPYVKKECNCQIDYEIFWGVPYMTVTINTHGNGAAWKRICWRLGNYGNKYSIFIEDAEGLLKLISWELLSSKRPPFQKSQQLENNCQRPQQILLDLSP